MTRLGRYVPIHWMRASQGKPGGLLVIGLRAHDGPRVFFGYTPDQVGEPEEQEDGFRRNVDGTWKWRAGAWYAGSDGGVTFGDTLLMLAIGLGGTVAGVVAILYRIVN